MFSARHVEPPNRRWRPRNGSRLHGMLRHEAVILRPDFLLQLLALGWEPYRAKKTTTMRRVSEHADIRLRRK